jgi:hypothetical protein
VILQKYKSQGKSVEVTLNSKEENYEDFCLDFVQEFGLRLKSATGKKDFLVGLEVLISYLSA